MHGHQLRQLAEKEHIDSGPTSPSAALYGAIKRLAAEGLIEEVRVEREGHYPERQVWRITDAGPRVALHELRIHGLQRGRHPSPTRSTSRSAGSTSTRPTSSPASSRAGSPELRAMLDRDRGPHAAHRAVPQRGSSST